MCSTTKMFRQYIRLSPRAVALKLTESDVITKTRKWNCCVRCFSSLPEFAQALPMPALSPTMTSGNISSWNVKEGAAFDAGDVLCEVETDKATVDYEAVDAGILAKILIDEKAGKNVPVGKTIAIVVEDEEDLAKLQSMNLDLHDASAEQNESPSPGSDSGDSSGSNANQTTQATKEEKMLSPAARHLLDNHGVDPSQIVGTGKRGMITKGDALMAVKGGSTKQLPVQPVTEQISASQQATTTTPQPAEAPEAAGDVTDEELSTMRKVIASRLTESKRELPHFYTTIECEIDEVLSLRETLKKELGTAPSINDMVVRASALALRDVPLVNSQKVSDGTIEENDHIDVSVAVATPSGLITPIITNADKKRLIEISTDMKNLALRARENKLKLEEFQGGSFTVSNLGMFGINDFTAVINLPQAAILAVGGGVQKVKVSKSKLEEIGFESNEVDEKDLETTTVMTVSLSADRRVVDDATAALFLQCFQSYMSKPIRMSL